MEEKLKAFERLLNIMDDLREKCPWDKKQTIESLRHLTIEETYELSDAILKNNTEELKKELGDGPIFHRFGVRYTGKKGLMLQFALKSHWAIAYHFDLGAGYRIPLKKKKTVVKN